VLGGNNISAAKGGGGLLKPHLVYLPSSRLVSFRGRSWEVQAKQNSDSWGKDEGEERDGRRLAASSSLMPLATSQRFIHQGEVPR